MPPRQFIYLDNAATTRVAPEVQEIVRACMEDDFGNPSSAHAAGIAAESRVKKARRQLAAAIGDPEGARGELIFTSGGTESDALGILGAARAKRRAGKKIVLSAIEHPAVRESAAQLERDGFSVTLVPVGASGVVSVEAFVDRLEGAAVAALMQVNNEIGTIQPVAEVAAAIRSRGLDVHLHCDAVQALGKLRVDVDQLGADSLAFAAHKLHGPKGVGALWIRKGAKVTPLWAGGGQERGLRSGTLNVPGIAGLGLAAELAQVGLDDRRAAWKSFREILVTACADAGLRFSENGAANHVAGHVVSLAFEHCPAEPLLHVLESRGVLVSAGSACSERDRKPSPVLSAIGVPEHRGTVRLSFGRDTTVEEVERAAEVLIDAVRDFQR